MIKTIVASLLALLLAVPAFALDGARILEQVDRGLNPESYEMYRKLINVEPSGAKKEFTLFLRQEGQGQDCRPLPGPRQ